MLKAKIKNPLVKATKGFVAESKRFELSNGFRPLHDFQSCSLDQLGQLSKYSSLISGTIYYTQAIKKNQDLFSKSFNFL